MNDPIPFALPDVGEEEITAVSEAIRSGWLSSGPLVKRFEAEFAKTIGSDVQAIAVNSATAGLHLALEAVGVCAGDEVLVPTWTFTATAEVVRYLGATPILVDVDPTTLCIDFEQASKKVSSKTKAIMPVHFAGLPMAAETIADFARQHNLKVVEDAAHAFPAAWCGKPVGSGLSEATIFSFYATKTITTGEGGMVITGNPQIAQRIRTMRLHGISRDAFDRYRSATPSWRYEVIAPGYKYNLTDPAAAMGLGQLSKAGSMRDRRQQIAETYSEALTDLPLQLPTAPPAAFKHAWHLYVARLSRDPVNRDQFISDLAERHIGTSVHFIPLHKQPYWSKFGTYLDSDFPVASEEFKRVVSLPIFSSMTEDQVERVIDTTRKVLLK